MNSAHKLGKSNSRKDGMYTSDNTTSSISPFNFGIHAVRVVIKDGEPWFVAKDVCDTLGYTHVPHAMRILDDDEKGVHLTDTLGGSQKLSVVNESGLYALVLRSRKPEARKFAKWVTSEVLPAIRKTGRYEHVSPHPAEAPRETLNETVARLVKQVEAPNGAPADIFVPLVDAVMSRGIGTIRVHPEQIIKNAADMAGQVFAAALKQGALAGTRLDRFVVTADYKTKRCEMSAIERDAFILPISKWSSAIATEATLAQAATLMGACADKLTRHHTQTALSA